MNIDTARRFLLWCALINYGVMMLWFLVFILAHDLIYQIHGRWFRLSVEQFDALHYMGMSIYKLGVLLLNVVPYLALLIVGRGGGDARR
jgi:hypothetical protein